MVLRRRGRPHHRDLDDVAGCAEGGRGALLELYGRSDQLDLRLLGSTLGLAASAVLGTTVSQLDTTPARMSP